MVVLFDRLRFKKTHDHGGSEEHRGRPATGPSQESLEIEKLSRSIWYGSRSSVWLAKRMHDTKLTYGCVFYFAASVALYAR